MKRLLREVAVFGCCVCCGAVCSQMQWPHVNWLCPCRGICGIAGGCSDGRKSFVGCKVLLLFQFFRNPLTYSPLAANVVWWPKTALAGGPNGPFRVATAPVLQCRVRGVACREGFVNDFARRCQGFHVACRPAICCGSWSVAQAA